MSASNDGLVRKGLFDREYQKVINNLNNEMSSTRKKLLNKTFEDLLSCPSCKGRWHPSYRSIDAKKRKLIEEEVKFGFGSELNEAVTLDAMWLLFCQSLKAHLATLHPTGPCEKHRFAIESVEELHEQSSMFRTGLLDYAESMKAAETYGRRLEAAGDSEEAQRFVANLGSRLELDVETMLILGYPSALLSK